MDIGNDETFFIEDDTVTNDDAELTLVSNDATNLGIDSSTFTLGSTFTLASASQSLVASIRRSFVEAQRGGGGGSTRGSVGHGRPTHTQSPRSELSLGSSAAASRMATRKAPLTPRSQRITPPPHGTDLFRTPEGSRQSRLSTPPSVGTTSPQALGYKGIPVKLTPRSPMRAPPLVGFAPVPAVLTSGQTSTGTPREDPLASHSSPADASAAGAGSNKPTEVNCSNSNGVDAVPSVPKGNMDAHPFEFSAPCAVTAEEDLGALNRIQPVDAPRTYSKTMPRYPSALPDKDDHMAAGTKKPEMEEALEQAKRDPVERLCPSAQVPQEERELVSGTAVVPPVFVTASSVRVQRVPSLVSGSRSEDFVPDDALATGAVAGIDGCTEKPAAQAFLDAVKQFGHRSPTSSISAGLYQSSPLMMSSRKRSVVFDESRDNMDEDHSGLVSASQSFDIPMHESAEGTPTSVSADREVTHPTTSSRSATPSIDKSGDEGSTPTERNAKRPPIRLPSYASLGGIRSSRSDRMDSSATNHDSSATNSPPMLPLQLSYAGTEKTSSDRGRPSGGELLLVAAEGGFCSSDPNIAAMLSALQPVGAPSNRTSPMYQHLQDALSPKQRYQNFQYGDEDPLASGTHSSAAFVGSRRGFILAGSSLKQFDHAKEHTPDAQMSASFSKIGDEDCPARLVNVKAENRDITAEEECFMGENPSLSNVGDAANKRAGSLFRVSADGTSVVFDDPPKLHDDAQPALRRDDATPEVTPPSHTNNENEARRMSADAMLTEWDHQRGVFASDAAVDFQALVWEHTLFCTAAQWLREQSIRLTEVSIEVSLMGLTVEEQEGRRIVLCSEESLWIGIVVFLCGISRQCSSVVAISQEVTSCWRHHKDVVDEEASAWGELVRLLKSDSLMMHHTHAVLEATELGKRECLHACAELSFRSTVGRHQVSRSELLERHRIETSMDATLVAAYTCAQEANTRCHILVDYLSRLEWIERDSCLKSEFLARRRALFVYGAEGKHRAMVEYEGRTEWTLLRCRWGAVVAAVPMEFEARQSLDTEATMQLQYVYGCAVPRFQLFGQQEVCRREVYFSCAQAFVELHESFQREQLQLRLKWLQAALTRANATLHHYLYAVVPFWISLSSRDLCGPPSIAAWDFDAPTVSLIVAWGTPFSDVWRHATQSEQAARALLRRRVYFRRAPCVLLGISSQGVKRPDAASTRIREAKVCMNQRKQRCGPCVFQGQESVRSNRTIQEHQRRTHKHSSVTLPRSLKLIGPVPFKRLRTEAHATFWRQHWRCCRREDRHGNRSWQHREQVIYMRDAAFRLRINTLRSRAQRRKVVLTERRNAPDLVVNRNDRTQVENESLPPALQSCRHLEEIAPNTEVVWKGVYSNHALGMLWSRKPIICVQMFARARSSCLLVALLKQRRVSKYAATLRSMVCRYDYLDSYASQLQGAVEAMITHRTASSRSASNLTAQATGAVSRLREGVHHDHKSVDELYRASVYYRKDEMLLPTTRRPFSAGKVRAQPHQHSFAHLQPAPDPSKTSRPQSAQSRSMSARATARPTSSADRTSSPTDAIVQRMDAIDAVVDHWAARQVSAAGRLRPHHRK